MTHSLNKRTSADRPLFYCFLAVIAWIPLPLGSNRLWASTLLCSLVLFLVTWWLVLLAQDKVSLGNTFKKSIPVMLLLLIAPLWAAIQVFLPLANERISIDWSNTLHQSLLGLSLLFLFGLTVLTARSKRRIKLLAYTLIISGLIQAVYGSMMTLTGIEYTFLIPKDSYIGRATGTFINRNHLAGYLVLCLSVGIGIMIATLKNDGSKSWREHSRNLFSALLGSKARLRITLIIMVAGLVMTHSRMGNTAFFASMAIAGILALILSKRSTKSTIILITSLIVIDIFVVGAFFGVDKVAQRLQDTSAESETRDEVNTYTSEIIQDHLITGTGAGTYYTSFPEYREFDTGNMYYDHAHNDYFQFLSEYGLVGSIPLLLAVMIVFTNAIRAQYKRKNPLLRGIAFSCTMAVIALAIHSTVDFNLQIPANAATFMVILGLGQISLYQRFKKRER